MKQQDKVVIHNKFLQTHPLQTINKNQQSYFETQTTLSVFQHSKLPKWLIPTCAPTFCALAVSFLLGSPIFKLQKSPTFLPARISQVSLIFFSRLLSAGLNFGSLSEKSKLFHFCHGRLCYTHTEAAHNVLLASFYKVTGSDVYADNQGAELRSAGYGTELCTEHMSKVLFTQQHHMIQRSRPLLYKACSLTTAETCP